MALPNHCAMVRVARRVPADGPRDTPGRPPGSCEACRPYRRAAVGDLPGWPAANGAAISRSGTRLTRTPPPVREHERRRRRPRAWPVQCPPSCLSDRYDIPPLPERAPAENIFRPGKNHPASCACRARYGAVLLTSDQYRGGSSNPCPADATLYWQARYAFNGLGPSPCVITRLPAAAPPRGGWPVTRRAILTRRTGPMRCGT